MEEVVVEVGVIPQSFKLLINVTKSHIWVPCMNKQTREKNTGKFSQVKVYVSRQGFSNICIF